MPDQCPATCGINPYSHRPEQTGTGLSQQKIKTNCEQYTGDQGLQRGNAGMDDHPIIGLQHKHRYRKTQQVDKQRDRQQPAPHPGIQCGIKQLAQLRRIVGCRILIWFSHQQVLRKLLPEHRCLIKTTEHPKQAIGCLDRRNFNGSSIASCIEQAGFVGKHIQQ